MQQKQRECQVRLLQNTIVQSEELLKISEKTDEVYRYIKILENFMRKTPVICYGGTAINNILPIESRFYNEYDIVDYDLYSSTPLEHAKQLADYYYYDHGILETTASAGVHAGTFKVFVNFIPIADFTYLSPHTFNILLKEKIIIDCINYCSPNFLRMNMLYELSHTLNSPDRLEKVFLRFQLLNIHYPMNAESIACQNENITNNKKFISATILALIENNVVFIGEFLYFFFFKNKQNNIPVEFDVLCNHFSIVVKNVKEKLVNAGASEITVHYKNPNENDPKFQHVEIFIGTKRWVTLWNTDSAINYNNILFKSNNPIFILNDTLHSRMIQIGTTETMMLYFYYFYYLERRFFKKERLLCMISFLLKEYLASCNVSGIWKHFSVECYGKPTSLREIRLFKSMKYEEFKNDKTSKEYEWLFLKYNPRLNSNKKYNKKDKDKNKFKNYAKKRTNKKTNKRKTRQNKTQKILN
jgi:hypothetical protein